MKTLSEKEKMLAGELYNPLDPELIADRQRARQFLREFNSSLQIDDERHQQSLTELLGALGEKSMIQAPFFCDYGSNIYLGEWVYFNYNCVVLDVAVVEIGSHSMFGPNVQIYTATHPLDYRERASGLEYGKRITIGEHVWVGGSAIIGPGISIGDRSVIGAGSVVVKDIPSDVFAAGNPCRVIRTL